MSPARSTKTAASQDTGCGCLAVVVGVVALVILYGCSSGVTGPTTADDVPSSGTLYSPQEPSPSPTGAAGLAEACRSGDLERFVDGVETRSWEGAVAPGRAAAERWAKALRAAEGGDDLPHLTRALDAVNAYLKAAPGSTAAWRQGRAIAQAAIDLADHCDLIHFIDLPPAKKPQPKPRKPKPSRPPATDPRFGTCGQANAAGYGPYVRGLDQEYGWYQDRDGDGRVCEP